MRLHANDVDDISRLRNQVVYAGVRNPLIEWTLSSEWTEIPRIVDWKGDRLARGSKVGMTGITFNECHGEIVIRDYHPTACKCGCYAR